MRNLNVPLLFCLILTYVFIANAEPVWRIAARESIKPLNVPAAPNWQGVLNAQPTAQGPAGGPIGRSFVSQANYSQVVSSWGWTNPEMKQNTLQNLELIIVAALGGAVGEYLAHTFVADTNSRNGQLSSIMVLVVADYDQNIGITYLMSTVTGSVKQQKTTIRYKVCHKKFFFWKDCSWKTREENRGDTPEELHRVEQQLRHVQYEYLLANLQTETFASVVLAQEKMMNFVRPKLAAKSFVL